mgnify:CR=1 FL=1
MSQENNWPRHGFTRVVDTDRLFTGTAKEVLNDIEQLFY